MPVARYTDPITSHEAAESIGFREVRQRQLDILDVLRAAGVPLTDEEIYGRLLLAVDAGYMLPQSPSGARTRRHELVALKLVEASGEFGILPSGRRSIRWRACAQEPKQLQFGLDK